MILEMLPLIIFVSERESTGFLGYLHVTQAGAASTYQTFRNKTDELG